MATDKINLENIIIKHPNISNFGGNSTLIINKHNLIEDLDYRKIILKIGRVFFETEKIHENEIYQKNENILIEIPNKNGLAGEEYELRYSYEDNFSKPSFIVPDSISISNSTMSLSEYKKNVFLNIIKPHLDESEYNKFISELK